ncbi:uncharacterized protein LOC119997091 [Tripterygium wilfordii]|uniref:uncharacterized protein LOC119997091 n=1 Tax=Tripterygium wilfordii TaxID=458696 RepID=UPI0018F8167A|nr:uncharacterized protein LOC119997091 [Tripterygium wilfordii]XP_038699818.1 uncharacterized protein LOC119997091 [Tripterygium wilfordii]
MLQQELCSSTLVVDAVLSRGFCEERLRLKIVIGRVYDPGGPAMNNSVIVVLNKLDKTKDVTKFDNGKEILTIILELQEETWNAYKVFDQLLPKGTSSEKNLEHQYLKGEHMFIMADCHINGYQVLGRLFDGWKEETELVKGEVGFLHLATHSMTQGALPVEQSNLNMPRKQSSVSMGGTTSIATAILDQSMNWSTIESVEVENEGNGSTNSQTSREALVFIAIDANHFPFDPGGSKSLIVWDSHLVDKVF